MDEFNNKLNNSSEAPKIIGSNVVNIIDETLTTSRNFHQSMATFQQLMRAPQIDEKLTQEEKEKLKHYLEPYQILAVYPFQSLFDKLFDASTKRFKFDSEQSLLDAIKFISETINGKDFPWDAFYFASGQQTEFN
jgi:hypothetical protein